MSEGREAQGLRLNQTPAPEGRKGIHAAFPFEGKRQFSNKYLLLIVLLSFAPLGLDPITNSYPGLAPPLLFLRLFVAS